MTVPFTVKAVKIGNSIRMTIPKEIVSYLQISEGDSLTVHVDDNHMTVRKK